MNTNANENNKLRNINYNFYYQNNITFSNNYLNKYQDNISNDFSSSTKNDIIDKNTFIKKKLKLKNLFGDLFKENFVIIINEYGIENLVPMRKKYDGKTKFGPIIYDQKNNNINPINDFQIFTLDFNIKTLFIIKYDKNSKKYYLISNIENKDEIQDLNIFIKLEKDLPILRKIIYIIR